MPMKIAHRVMNIQCPAFAGKKIETRDDHLVLTR
jgi:hypothetical protein